jgi:hypothetical protein
MTNDTAFETINLDNLNTVNGGGFWGDLGDAALGAVNIVTSPARAVYRGAKETYGSLRAGHGVGDSLSSGLVQAAEIPNVPKLSTIPAK